MQFTQTLILCSILFLLSPAAAFAQAIQILGADFDTTTPINVTADYNFNGSITDVGTGSIGVGGSQGAFVEFDGSGANSGDIPRLNIGFGSAKTTVPTTTDLGKIEFSIDLAQSGSVGATADLWANLFGFDSSLNNLFIIRSPNLTAGSGFTTFTSTLDTWTIASGSWDVANIDQINVSIQEIGFAPTGDEFGFDSGNFIYADNLSLTQIPEPGTTGAILGGLGLLGAVAYRRKFPKH